MTKKSRQDAKRLFRLCLTNGVLNSDRARQVASELAAGKPRGYLAILTRFQRLIELEEYRRSALIESAMPIEAHVQSALRSNLERRYGHGLDFQFALNPALIGGMRVRVGSDVYDGTVSGRLDAVRQAFDSE